MYKINTKLHLMQLCTILISIYSNMIIHLVTHRQFINLINNIKLFNKW